MANFIQFVNELSKLDKKATDELTNKLHTKTIQKGAYLLENGEKCRKIFFIDQGLVKTYFNGKDKAFIMKFFPENSMFTVLDSYIQQTVSNYTILALETTTITFIYKSDLEALCTKHHSIETFFGKLISSASINMMKRISEMLEENATERYNHFVKEHSQLLQRISLGDLANYLGITQVSLSRIRAKK